MGKKREKKKAKSFIRPSVSQSVISGELMWSCTPTLFRRENDSSSIFTCVFSPFCSSSGEKKSLLLDFCFVFFHSYNISRFFLLLPSSSIAEIIFLPASNGFFSPLFPLSGGGFKLWAQFIVLLFLPHLYRVRRQKGPSNLPPHPVLGHKGRQQHGPERVQTTPVLVLG